jgi:TPR repeat protein
MGMDGVAMDVARAAERSPYAASAEELFHLGIMYSLGLDGAPDLVAAQKWLSLAAMKGSAPARICRRELACEMTPEQVAEAQRLAGQVIVPHS